jgi:hypothetical protein
VHGGFWLLSDDEYRIGPSIAENLVRDGVAVALLRYRLAPADLHPTQAEDVTADVAHLIKNAEKYGFWNYDKLVRAYPIDARLKDKLLFVFRQRQQELLEWPLKQYHAIDLFAYLDALPKERVGAGEYLIVTKSAVKSRYGNGIRSNASNR